MSKTGSLPGGIRILSAFGEVQYQIALYGTNDSVPVPFLTRCPETRTITPGDTEAFNLGADNTDVWFEVTFDAGTYDIVMDAAVADGSRTNIIYQTHVTNAFADIETAERLLNVNEIGVTNRTTNSITVDRPGTYYIWAELSSSVLRDYNMEISVNPR